MLDRKKCVCVWGGDHRRCQCRQTSTRQGNHDQCHGLGHQMFLIEVRVRGSNSNCLRTVVLASKDEVFSFVFGVSKVKGAMCESLN